MNADADTRAQGQKRRRHVGNATSNEGSQSAGLQATFGRLVRGLQEHGPAWPPAAMGQPGAPHRHRVDDAAQVPAASSRKQGMALLPLMPAAVRSSLPGAAAADATHIAADVDEHDWELPLDLCASAEPTSRVQDDGRDACCADGGCEENAEDFKYPRHVALAIATAAESESRPLIERFRPNGSLSVTDLTMTMWCEVQSQYQLETRQAKAATKAMRAGTQIHEAQELLVHARVEIEIDPARAEEPLAVKMLQIMQGLDELDDGALAREIPVYGFVQDVLVRGIVDEIRAVPREEEHAVPEARCGSTVQDTLDSFVGYVPGQRRPTAPRLEVTDLKTRQTPTLPSARQQEQAELQVSLYCLMLGQMTEREDLLVHICQALGIDHMVVLREEFVEQVLRELAVFDPTTPRGRLRRDSMSQAPTLHSMWHELVYPRLSAYRGRVSDDRARVVYRDSSTEGAPIIHEHSFRIDPDERTARLDTLLSWWQGRRPSVGVSPDEAGYKCRMCAFELGCSWRRDQAAAAHLQHRRKYGPYGKYRRASAGDTAIPKRH